MIKYGHRNWIQNQLKVSLNGPVFFDISDLVKIINKQS